MKQKRATVVVVALLVATDTRAQIGRDKNGCLQLWGEPVAGQVVSNGIGTLTFAPEDCAVELGFVDGIARHAVYRKPSMNQEKVDRLLSINSEDRRWAGNPGRRGEKDKGRQWIRSDDMAMATLEPGVLTVVGSEWNQRLSMSPAEPPAAPPAGSQQGSSSDDIVGFWQARRSGIPPVVLHLRMDGTMSWIVLGNTERRDFEARWHREASDGQAVYTLREIQPSATEPSRRIGSFQRESPVALRFRAEQSVSGRQDMREWNAAKEMVFQRIPEMPWWKPKAPAILPAKGDSREETVRLLGHPSGIMASRGREVLVYPWGNVWVSKEKVIGIE